MKLTINAFFVRIGSTWWRSLRLNSGCRQAREMREKRSELTVLSSKRIQRFKQRGKETAEIQGYDAQKRHLSMYRFSPWILSAITLLLLCG